MINRQTRKNYDKKANRIYDKKETRQKCIEWEIRKKYDKREIRKNIKEGDKKME